MELQTLMGGLKAASLDTGGRTSAGEARRIACRAGIIPLVLGGPSVVLDAGRRRRFHSETQRIVMGVRDGDAPLSDVTHLRACRMHDPAFQHSLDKHGKVRFARRT